MGYIKKSDHPTEVLGFKLDAIQCVSVISFHSRLERHFRLGQATQRGAVSSAGRGGKQHNEVNIPPFPLPWQPAHCRQRLFHPPADHRHLLMDVQCASPFWLMEDAATPGQLLAGASSPL